MCLHHICCGPQLTRLHCDLPTHMHWHYQRRTHRNQVRTLPVSFVLNNNLIIIKWKCVQLTGQHIANAEAKFCAQIEDVAFAATIKLCCTWISEHDEAMVCTSLNELPAFMQFSQTLLSEKERPDFAMIGDWIALCLLLLLAQSACRMAYIIQYHWIVQIHALCLSFCATYRLSKQSMDCPCKHGFMFWVAQSLDCPHPRLVHNI